jgi:hypothetical protein
MIRATSFCAGFMIELFEPAHGNWPEEPQQIGEDI